MTDVTRKGHSVDSGLGRGPGRHSRRWGQTQAEGGDTQGGEAAEEEEAGPLASGGFNLVTSTLAFFTALEGNPKL